MTHKMMNLDLSLPVVRNRPCGKESTEVQISQNKGKENENLPEIEEITVGQAHRNCFEIFRQARPSFSIRREQMFVNTR